ncbi:unnamed protein product [Paramecium octaurelia]|uniref:Uncharacterized protein n=1 Tax=Paramecium octaurelia TaxID=43137 RepID=A0A8S1W621_PAROT|nr:unnamed protein product [Paramecium octaurelia]
MINTNHLIGYNKRDRIQFEIGLLIFSLINIINSGKIYNDKIKNHFNKQYQHQLKERINEFTQLNQNINDQYNRLNHSPPSNKRKCIIITSQNYWGLPLEFDSTCRFK